VKRKDFQELAAIRLKEARILFENGCWEGAYYLGGYAAECALKACIAKQTARYDFPDKATTIASYTHNMEELLRLAKFDSAAVRTLQTDPTLSVNWTIVRDWRENSRYARPSRQDSEALLDALGARKHGILAWLKHHW
jgi:HEPN domain-containing protein